MTRRAAQACAWLAGLLGSSGGFAALPFEPIQPALLPEPGSISNAWGDYDGDGYPDLAVSLASGEVRLYRNDRGTLRNVGAGLGMPQAGAPELRGLSWGDADGDGDLDLLGGPTSASASPVLLRNDGGRRFVDVAQAAGLGAPGRSARQTNWIDYDNDGDLDVYATNRAGPNALFRNTGGSFVPVPAERAAADPRPSVGACWFDVDLDGDLDLFLANQSGAADALWRNDRGGFVDVAPALGLSGPPRSRDEGGVGCAVADYDNDGDFDLFVASYGRNLLYRNEGAGPFSEVGRELGVGRVNRAVGADWGDYDNDGDLDLFVTAYTGAGAARVPAAALFRNDGAAGFVDVLAAEDPLNAGDHGVQFVDFDRDGALDLSLTGAFGQDGGHFVFRNAAPRSVARRSLSVLVLDAAGRHTRFGAEVRLHDARGRLLASRLVPAGSGYDSQGAGPVHFGLVERGPVRIETTFMTPAGRRVKSLQLRRPAAWHGRSIVIREPRFAE